ncbi:MAG: NADH-quinone oxidoreductase subunit A [Bdellovibrionales bacterium]
MLDQLLPVAFMAIFVMAFGGGLLFVASLVGPKPKELSLAKQSVYESGTFGESAGSTKVPIKYYLTAILFIIFDIEAVFIYPWATIYKDFLIEGNGVFISVEMGIFMLTLIFGLFYVWKAGALDWE